MSTYTKFFFYFKPQTSQQGKNKSKFNDPMKTEIPNPHSSNFTSYFFFSTSYLAISLYRTYLVVDYLVRHHAEIGEPDGESRLAALTVLPEARPDPVMLRIIRPGRIYKYCRRYDHSHRPYRYRYVPYRVD